MPYIPQEKREGLDWLVDQMGRLLKVDGDLNYVIFAFTKRYIQPRYVNYRNFFGELNEAVAEARRRFLVPYEGEKIIEHGDVE